MNFQRDKLSETDIKLNHSRELWAIERAQDNYAGLKPMIT